MNGINKILILFLAHFVLLLNGLTLYFDKVNASGFFFERIGYLLTNYNTGDDILSSYKTLPLEACFPISTSLVTGIDIFDTVFLPILPTIGIIPIFLLSRCFFDSDKDGILVSIPIFLFVFALLPHLVEYSMSQFFFCFFIYGFFKFSTTTKARPKFFVIILILFLAIKFFGPPMEIWALSFIFFFIIATFATARYNANLIRENDLFYSQLTFTILIFVICFSYNPKFYGGLLYLNPTPDIFQETLERFLGNLIFSTSPVLWEPFVTSPVSPTPLRLTNTLYFILIALPLVLIPIYHIFHKRLVNFLIRDIRAISAISLLIPFVAELIIYGSLGAMPMRYFLLVYPIISMYWISKLPSKKTFYAILVCLIVISCLSFALHQRYDLYRKFPGEISGQSMTGYLGDNTERGIELMTDHHTFGCLRIFFSEIFCDPSYFQIRLYNSDRYAKIVGMNEDEIKDFDYLIINLGYLNFTTYGPGKPGEESWKHFEPLGKYYSKINSNSKLNNIYINREFAIYGTSAMEH